MCKTPDYDELWKTCRDIQIILVLGLIMVYKYLARYLPSCLKITGGMTYVKESYEKKPGL